MAQIINASYNSMPQQVEENKNNIAKSNEDITTANTNIAKNTSDINTANTNIAKNAIDITNANANITKNASDITTANTNIIKNANDITNANANITKNTSDITTANTNIAKNTDEAIKNKANIKVLSSNYLEELSHKSGNVIFNFNLDYTNGNISIYDNVTTQESMIQVNIKKNLEINKIYKFEFSTIYNDFKPSSQTTSEIFPHDIYYGYINTTTIQPSSTTPSTAIQFIQLAHNSTCEVGDYSSPSRGITIKNVVDSQTKIKFAKNLGDMYMARSDQFIPSKNNTNFIIPIKTIYIETMPTPIPPPQYVHLRIIDLGIVGSLV